MMGTKKGASSVNAPVVLVLWVVVQRGGHFLLNYKGPYLEGILRVMSSCSSDAKLVGAGEKASCKPAGLDKKSALLCVICKYLEGFGEVEHKSGGCVIHFLMTFDKPRFTTNSGFNVYLWIGGVHIKGDFVAQFRVKAESAVGWERSGLLCLASNSNKCCWNLGQISLVSSGCQEGIQGSQKLQGGWLTARDSGFK
eukprot:1161250-Pelagomonas_calceolata.AAC.2